MCNRRGPKGLPSVQIIVITSSTLSRHSRLRNFFNRFFIGQLPLIFLFNRTVQTRCGVFTLWLRFVALVIPNLFIPKCTLVNNEVEKHSWNAVVFSVSHRNRLDGYGLDARWNAGDAICLLPPDLWDELHLLTPQTFFIDFRGFAEIAREKLISRMEPALLFRLLYRLLKRTSFILLPLGKGYLICIYILYHKYVSFSKSRGIFLCFWSGVSYRERDDGDGSSCSENSCRTLS